MGASMTAVAPRRRDSGGSSRGFTLVELLVAVTVMASIALMGWKGLDSILRARAGVTLQMDQTRGMHLSFAQMESDFARIASAAMIGGRPRLLADAGQVMLIRTVFGENQPTQYQVVCYRVRNDVLIRSESSATRDMKVLDAHWNVVAAGADGRQQAVALQHGVASMTFRAWINDGSGWRDPNVATERVMIRDGNGWRPAGEKDGAADVSGPSGLEVVLGFANSDAKITKVFLLGAT